MVAKLNPRRWLKLLGDIWRADAWRMARGSDRAPEDIRFLRWKWLEVRFSYDGNIENSSWFG